MITSVIASALLIGANAQQAPEPSYKNVHTDWTVECFNAPKTEPANTPKVCQMFQQVTKEVPEDKKNPKGKKVVVPILRASVTLFDKQPVMVFAAPLEVQLSEGIKIRLNKNDDKDGKIYVTVKDKDGKDVDTDIQQIDFERCTGYGCIAALPLNVDISNKLLEKIQKGNVLFVNYTFDANAKKDSDANINANVSLSGFSDAYADLIKQASAK